MDDNPSVIGRLRCLRRASVTRWVRPTCRVSSGWTWFGLVMVPSPSRLWRPSTSSPSCSSNTSTPCSLLAVRLEKWRPDARGRSHDHVFYIYKDLLRVRLKDICPQDALTFSLKKSRLTEPSSAAVSRGWTLHSEDVMLWACCSLYSRCELSWGSSSHISFWQQTKNKICL